MTEAIDEYVMSHLTEFDDKKFQDASKDNLKLGKDDKKAAKVVQARSCRSVLGVAPHLGLKAMSIDSLDLSGYVSDQVEDSDVCKIASSGRECRGAGCPKTYTACICRVRPCGWCRVHHARERRMKLRGSSRPRVTTLSWRLDEEVFCMGEFAELVAW